MTKVPILCRSCENLSVSESILGGEAPFAAFENVGVGPCPHCGGDCDVLDGGDSFLDGTISFLSAPDRTVSELQCLASILRRAKSRGESVRTVAAEIQKDLPSVSSLIQAFPTNRAEFYACITIMIAMLSLLLEADQKNRKRTITANQVMNHIHTQQSCTLRPMAQPSSLPKPSPKLRPNDVCHCGSGKKFKKCHGNGIDIA